MIIEFDEQLKLQNFTNITEEVIVITVVPNIEHTNVTKLNFTFECIEFNKTEMKIQLNFSEPDYVSFYGDDFITV